MLTDDYLYNSFTLTDVTRVCPTCHVTARVFRGRVTFTNRNVLVTCVECGTRLATLNLGRIVFEVGDPRRELQKKPQVGN